MKTILILLSLVTTELSIAAISSNRPKPKTSDAMINQSEPNMELSMRLRARLMNDDQLSTQAHNIQIITDPEAITLKGRVVSRAEKVRIENVARSMAGDKRVYNQLTYK